VYDTASADYGSEIGGGRHSIAKGKPIYGVKETISLSHGRGEDHLSGEAGKTGPVKESRGRSSERILRYKEGDRSATRLTQQRVIARLNCARNAKRACLLVLVRRA